jgi:tetratricopeptide (TPR) repeat protein
MLEQRGDRAGAAAAFRKALAAKPQLAGPYSALAALGESLSDEELLTAERQAARADLPRDERSSFCFALARSFEKREDFDRAFAFARQGNELQRHRTQYNDARARDFVQQSIATFTPALFQQDAGGSPSERPLFIVGFPRSGSTLVEQILASHPAAVAGGELVEIPDIRDLLSDVEGAYPHCVAALTKEKLEQLALRYLARLDRIDPKAMRVTDKLPFNFRNLGLIGRMFPQARVIHCRRDPRDIAVSNYFIKFHRPISYAQSLFDFGQYWRNYRRLMKHWDSVLPRSILHVDYERIVANPESEIRRIIEFAGLPWDARCLRFYETESVVRTASMNQIRNPIYSASVGRWRHYAKHLTPLFFELGHWGRAFSSAPKG